MWSMSELVTMLTAKYLESTSEMTKSALVVALRTLAQVTPEVQ